jgi:hypothetical protein
MPAIALIAAPHCSQVSVFIPKTGLSLCEHVNVSDFLTAITLSEYLLHPMAQAEQRFAIQGC